MGVAWRGVQGSVVPAWLRNAHRVKAADSRFVEWQLVHPETETNVRSTWQTKKFEDETTQLLRQIVQKRKVLKALGLPASISRKTCDVCLSSSHTHDTNPPSVLRAPFRQTAANVSLRGCAELANRCLSSSEVRKSFDFAANTAK